MATVSSARRQTKEPLEVVAPHTNGDGGGLAVLRANRPALRLVVDYRGQHCRIELDRNRQALVSGLFDPKVKIDGDELAPVGDWEQTCWVSDDDVNYLELQLDLTDDVRIQRHVVLARDDEFLFLADAVLGERPGRVDYHASLPLAADLSAEGNGETREIALRSGDRRRAMVLPLALGEWRSERWPGELSIAPRTLELTQSAHDSRSLFAPWFIDLAPRRLRRPVTWRRLTVAEDREIQPADVAVGYRVQVGSRQWLFYRSLGRCGNRTLLGHNLVSEFLAARFDRRGVAETLIEIEAPADDNE